MNPRRCLHAVFLTGLLLAPASPAVEVWTASSMHRVMRDDASGKSSAVTLSAARGEWESFQIVVTGEATETRTLTLLPHEAQLEAGTATLPAPRIFREHYVTVSQSTPMSCLPPGDYPDALLPLELEPPATTRSGTGNQPFWVDVFVPYNTPAGRYAGHIEIRNDSGGVVETVPYSVEVRDFDLPVVPRLRTSFGLTWRRIAEVHGFDRDAPEPTPEHARLIDAYAALLAEHRLSVDQLESTYPDGRTGVLDKAAVERAMRDHLLHRHASTLGLPIWPDWPFGDPLGIDREAAQKCVADWVGLLSHFHAQDRAYVIMGALDEPNDAEAYERVREWGRFFDEVEEKHHVHIPLLITEQPTPERESWGRLDGAVDIWVAHFGSVWEDMESPNAPRDIEKRLAAGDEVWAYAALTQIPDEWERLHGGPGTLHEGHPPVWALDYPPMNHRILGWLLPIHGITGLAYWDMLYAADGVDVWKDAGVFHHPSGAIYNGDGAYLYPATQARFGTDQPVASIRLKWIRDAAEDYEYLMLATDLGLGEEARRWTQTFARGFGDWTNDIAALNTARDQIAARIVEALRIKEEGS